MPTPDPRQPHTYPRRILLMVTGRTPQVVTETVFALCRAQAPAFIPTEIRLITTSEGADDARLSLLSNDPGWFHALRKDYALPDIGFTAEHIDVLRDTDGDALPDIRNHSDNDRAADQIVARMRELTADPNSALHVSLAGGRKTMGYYLGYALSLFGRPQDRLSHVLVSAPYESNRDFYYPTPYPRVIYTYGATPQQQRPIDARDAQVTLADIPFVRLRDNLPAALMGLGTGEIGFTAVVNAAQRALDPPAITIDYPNGELAIHTGQRIHLPAAQLAFYGYIARRQGHGRRPVPRPYEHEADPDAARAYLAESQRAGTHPATRKRLESGMDAAFYDEQKSKTNRSLRKAIPGLAPAYLIRYEKGQGASIDIPTERIHFSEE